jgi:exodeoxyribonuclease-1
LSRTIYWHDYETFGADPRRDRAAQFAGIRTDEALNIIGEPLLIYCKPAPDMLPHPQACLITGITPQKALAEGLCEAEFIARIHAEFSQPDTCVAGYNSIRFDDELSRQILYRNFYDPYEREWKNGNSRWDIIDMLRLCAATRPQGIVWPQKEDGSPSFRLEMLTAANGIAHANAHDALADVVATIEMARLIRDRQPKLYEHIYQLRSKQAVQSQLNLLTRKPVLHVSMMYPAIRGCLALVAPLCRHPIDSNGVIVCDLRIDPANWIDLSHQEIRRLLFTSQQQLAEGEERIPLKVVHLNRCPVLVPAGVLSKELADKYSVDLTLTQVHWERLCADPVKLAVILEKISKAYDRRLLDLSADEEPDLEDDPDYMIYSGGFFSEADKRCMNAVRNCEPGSLGMLAPRFQDGRLHEMLFRYRARNWPEFLNIEEMQRWGEFCRGRLSRASAERGAGLDLMSFRAEVAKLRLERADSEALQILDEIEMYVDTLAGHLQIEKLTDNIETALL